MDIVKINVVNSKFFGGVPFAYIPNCQQLRLHTTFCLQLRLPTFPIAYRAIAYKHYCTHKINRIINIHFAHMTLLRTYTLHTWYFSTHKIKNRIDALRTRRYCAHAHCTHGIIAHMQIAHMTLLRTYTLHTW